MCFKKGALAILVDQQEHSYKEVAAIQGVPVGTVMSRLFRARGKVKAALAEYAQEKYGFGVKHAVAA